MPIDKCIRKIDVSSIFNYLLERNQKRMRIHLDLIYTTIFTVVIMTDNKLIHTNILVSYVKRKYLSINLFL